MVINWSDIFQDIFSFFFTGSSYTISLHLIFISVVFEVADVCKAIPEHFYLCGSYFFLFSPLLLLYHKTYMSTPYMTFVC